MEEKILEVVPVNWKKSMFKQEPWALVITDQRMLFAKWTQELFKKESEKRKEETKEAGGGKLKQFFSQMGTGFTYYKKYLEMTPDDILKEHNENFALAPSDIIRLDMKKGRGKGGAIINVKVGVNIGGSGDIDDLETPHELIITAKTGKMVFTFNISFAKVRGALSQSFNL
ncbi:MAG: hypothetical protein ACPLN1_00050 [Caldisericia bacterium]